MSSSLESVPTSDKSTRRPDILISVAAAGLLAAIYAATTSLWWTMDDAFHLHFLTQNPGLSYLSAPVWQTLPFRMLTPLLFASLQFDLWLFGFHAKPFYAHQVIAIAVAGAATYWLFRLWFDRITALTGTLLISLGAPVISMAVQLMLRHYVEGWVLATLSSLAFVVGVRTARPALSLLSALLFLLSALAKEVFVPLPIVFFLLPDGTTRQRMMALRPHLFALCLYVVWRRHMLGTLIGGYGWNTYASELPGLIARLPLEIGKAMFHTGSGWVLCGLLVLGVIGAIRVIPSARLMVAVAVTVLPIIPVAKSMEPRYAFGLMIVLVVTGMIAIGRVPSRWQLFIVCLVLALHTAAFVAFWRSSFFKASRMSTEARTFMALPEHDALRSPAVPPAAMAEFSWMKSAQFKRSGGSWFYDDISLCTSQPARVWEYSPAQRAVVDQTRRIGEIRRHTCSRQDRPLHATFDYREGVLSWTFGPYDTGTYRVIIGEGIQSFTVPARDSFQLPGVTGLSVRVRYDDQAGWTTYSDVINLDFARKPRLRWERR